MEDGKKSSRVFFIDLDGVVVEPGTQNLIDGAVKKLRRLSELGDIWLFSSWAFNENDMNFLNSLGVRISGIIQKPVADEYVVIDDRLNILLCDTALNTKHKIIERRGPMLMYKDCPASYPWPILDGACYPEEHSGHEVGILGVHEMKGIGSNLTDNYFVQCECGKEFWVSSQFLTGL